MRTVRSAHAQVCAQGRFQHVLDEHDDLLSWAREVLPPALSASLQAVSVVSIEEDAVWPVGGDGKGCANDRARFGRDRMGVASAHRTGLLQGYVNFPGADAVLPQPAATPAFADGRLQVTKRLRAVRMILEAGPSVNQAWRRSFRKS